MTDGAQERDEPSLSLGVALVLLSGGALVLSRGIEELGLARKGDPGSKAFPIGLALALLAAGGWLVFRWFAERKKRESGGAFSWDALKDGPAANLSAMVLSLAAYAWLLGPLGFASATLVFCPPWMKRLGSRWWVSVAMTVGLVVAVEVLFAGAFQVRLPEGTTFLAIDRFMVNM